MHTDYVLFFLVALFAAVGAGLFRVGLMKPESETSSAARKRWLYIAVGIAFGIAAVLILMVRAVKIGG